MAMKMRVSLARSLVIERKTKMATRAEQAESRATPLARAWNLLAAREEQARARLEKAKRKARVERSRRRERSPGL